MFSRKEQLSVGDEQGQVRELKWAMAEPRLTWVRKLGR